jgi:diadenylate cyclase
MASLVQLFTVADVVDVAIVSVILYRVIILIRNPAGFRLLLGLPIVFAVHFAARLAGLQTLAWLSTGVLGSSVILGVILFQADIRRWLLTAGRMKTAQGSAPGEVPEFIDEIASAAGSLGPKKIGALIVIERAVSLDPFIEVGTQIDAKVTSELLTSIFLPYSPIHDGAVIVRNGKIMTAGCFLPLTRSPGVEKHLGTRHRAALGLTEVTDAVVVVVSEETGGISVVVGGRITSNLDPQLLRQVLVRLLVAKEGGFGNA